MIIFRAEQILQASGASVAPPERHRSPVVSFAPSQPASSTSRRLRMTEGVQGSSSETPGSTESSKGAVFGFDWGSNHWFMVLDVSGESYEGEGQTTSREESGSSEGEQESSSSEGAGEQTDEVSESLFLET